MVLLKKPPPKVRAAADVLRISIEEQRMAAFFSRALRQFESLLTRLQWSLYNSGELRL